MNKQPPKILVQIRSTTHPNSNRILQIIDIPFIDRALYFLHDEEPEMEEDLACCLTQEFTCYRCSNPPKETPTSSKTPKKRKLNICNRDGNKLASSSDLSSVNSINKLPPFCESCSSLTPTQRAARDRNELKKSVECFKSEVNGVFNVHIVLSRPVDYEEDFVDMASQPNAIDQDFL